MSKYNIIKVINRILFQQMKIEEHAFDIQFEQIIYDSFLKKFGLKSIAEKKINSFINSIKHHKSTARIYLFGRFLNLFKKEKPLKTKDFYFYLTCI